MKIQAEMSAQPFVFATQIEQYLYFLNPKFQASRVLFCGSTAQFVLDLVGNTEERFSHDAAHVFWSLIFSFSHI